MPLPLGSGEVDGVLSRLREATGGTGGGLALADVWVPRRGEGTLEALLEEGWEDLRRTTVGRRLLEVELATKAGFFLADLLLEPEDDLDESGGVACEREEEASAKAVEADTWVPGSTSSDSSFSSCPSPSRSCSNEIEGETLDEESIGQLSSLGVFQVGVNILALLDCCVVESIPVFFSIGGGRDEPLLLPFSSSMVGGLDDFRAAFSCNTTASRRWSMPPISESVASSCTAVAVESEERAVRKVGISLLALGEDVGVVRITTSPSEIAVNMSATWLPRMLSRIFLLLHILQKKFSSLRPTSLARSFRFVV